MFLSYYKNLLDLSNRSMFYLDGLHDCNSVHYQRGLTSIVLRCCLHYSRLIMISYADATLVGDDNDHSFAVTWLSDSTFATEGEMTPVIDEIVTNPASANELCFFQNHSAVCMTEDEFCLTVNGSSRVKRCI